jgi:DNA sulfur modification protein DndC
MKRQTSLFENLRLTLEEAIELTVQSLAAYGANHRHWAVAYSGGKDSTATVTLLAWLLEQGRVAGPDTLTVLYADTGMELPPLHRAARGLLAVLRARGVQTRVVLPPLDRRFFVYVFGRGVPPPSNTFRWCTDSLKVQPMLDALADVTGAGEKALVLTGVRLGESAARDQRIAVSCSKNRGECGQGWFQAGTPEDVADTLAPLLHWRPCHVWDWLNLFAPSYGFPTGTIAGIYGDGDVRTGCVGCNLASRDAALENVLRLPEWAHLRPLLELRPLYAELKKGYNRLRKDGSETRKDGELVKNPCRLGPLTMEARRYGLERVLDIQARAGVDLVDDEERARILELIEAGTWPDGWDGTELTGDVLIPDVFNVEGRAVIQQSLAFWG